MNPPYHIEDGGYSRSSKPIYHKFIQKAIDLEPNYLLAVIPSRWMMGGLGLKNFREQMKNDCRIKIIVDDMSPSKFFPEVTVAGGTCYFLWDKNYNGKCNFNSVDRFLNEEDIIIREYQCMSILSKVRGKTKNFLGDIVSPVNPYGPRGNAKHQEKGIPCWFKPETGKAYVKPELVIDKQNNLHLWRVLVPRLPITGRTNFNKPIRFFKKKNVIIAAPGEVCTETYLVLISLDTKKEVKNFVSYVMTKFFMFMLRMRVASQDITRRCYNWVPNLENYKKPWTDEELYKIFDLDKEEKEFIEDKIK